MEVFMQPNAYAINFPEPKKTKYPAAIMTFRDHQGSQVKIKMPQEQFEAFIQSLNRRMDE